MEAGAGNSILDFETLLSDFLQILNGSSLNNANFVFRFDHAKVNWESLPWQPTRQFLWLNRAPSKCMFFWITWLWSRRTPPSLTNTFTSSTWKRASLTAKYYTQWPNRQVSLVDRKRPHKNTRILVRNKSSCNSNWFDGQIALFATKNGEGIFWFWKWHLHSLN